MGVEPHSAHLIAIFPPGGCAQVPHIKQRVVLANCCSTTGVIRTSSFAEEQVPIHRNSPDSTPAPTNLSLMPLPIHASWSCPESQDSIACWKRSDTGLSMMSSLLIRTWAGYGENELPSRASRSGPTACLGPPGGQVPLTTALSTPPTASRALISPLAYLARPPRLTSGGQRPMAVRPPWRHQRSGLAPLPGQAQCGEFIGQAFLSPAGGAEPRSRLDMGCDTGLLHEWRKSISGWFQCEFRIVQKHCLCGFKYLFRRVLAHSSPDDPPTIR